MNPQDQSVVTSPLDSAVEEKLTTAQRSHSLVWVYLVFLLIGGIFTAAWITGGASDAGPVTLIPVASAPVVPDFTLIAQDGRPVSRADYQNKVWIANFIYAQCPGPCPTLTARMASVQQALAKHKDQVRLASFSLDPMRDTPAILSDYARRFHADTNWWAFITGPSEEKMHELVEKGFLQSVVPGDDDNPMMHSNYVAVVDGAGRIRAFYDGMDVKSKPMILSAVRQLLREQGGS